MSIYKVDDFTYGVELEIGDIDTRIILPRGNMWDYKDYTVANSSGVCNDPKKEITIYGGEINTLPTKSIDDQLGEIYKIFKVLGDRKSINHTCNLHIHVGVPGLREDLITLKKLALYTYEHQDSVFNIVEELKKPEKNGYTDEEYKGAIKRFNRRKISHQKKLSKNILDKMLLSNNIDSFFESFAPIGEDGTVYWGTVTRCGINFMQMYKETPTIEYRHFPMTFDLEEIYSCLEWCQLYTINALISGETPEEIIRNNRYLKFPKFVDYNHKIQSIMNLTSVGKLTRREVLENIGILLEKGIIKKTDLHD